MFSAEKLELYCWYFSRYRYLKSHEKVALKNLRYFQHIRNTNPLRQNIGMRDMMMASIPMFNPKKEERTINSSDPYFREVLYTLPKEYEKLKRWKKMFIKRKRKHIGEISFENTREELHIKSCK